MSGFWDRLYKLLPRRAVAHEQCHRPSAWHTASIILINAWGKLVVMALMFAGRTGPLTLGFALATQTGRIYVTYPSEKVMIG